MIAPEQKTSHTRKGSTFEPLGIYNNEVPVWAFIGVVGPLHFTYSCCQGIFGSWKRELRYPAMELRFCFPACFPRMHSCEGHGAKERPSQCVGNLAHKLCACSPGWHSVAVRD